MRVYVNRERGSGWKIADDVYYECANCGDVFHSTDEDGGTCSCGNFHLDPGMARIHVEDDAKVRMFREEQQ